MTFIRSNDKEFIIYIWALYHSKKSLYRKVISMSFWNSLPPVGSSIACLTIIIYAALTTRKILKNPDSLKERKQIGKIGSRCDMFHVKVNVLFVVRLESYDARSSMCGQLSSGIRHQTNFFLKFFNKRELLLKLQYNSHKL